MMNESSEDFVSPNFLLIFVVRKPNRECLTNNKEKRIMSNESLKTLVKVAIAIVFALLTIWAVSVILTTEAEKKEQHTTPQSIPKSSQRVFSVKTDYGVLLTNGECYNVDSVVLCVYTEEFNGANVIDQVRENIYGYILDALEDASWESPTIDSLSTNTEVILSDKLASSSANIFWIEVYSTYTGVDNSLSIIDKREIVPKFN